MAHSRVERIFRMTVVAALTAAIFGCGQDPKDEEPTLTGLWERKLNTCGFNCHSPNDVSFGTDQGPDLSTKANFHANLVGKTVNDNYSIWLQTKQSDCNHIPLITAGDANNSTVVASLIQSYADQLTAAEGCNSAYNLHVTNNVTLDQETADQLVAWINAGAKND